MNMRELKAGDVFHRINNNQSDNFIVLQVYPKIVIFTYYPQRVGCGIYFVKKKKYDDIHNQIEILEKHLIHHLNFDWRK